MTTPDNKWKRWWGIALSEEVTGRGPLGRTLGDRGIVLFRDGEGQVRAFHDRCPHRRAPLSLGRMTPDGRLQCGYHGWIFDGESGNLSEIPKLGDQSRRRCHVDRYPTREHGGIVYIWGIAEAFDNLAAFTSQVAPTSAHAYSGSTFVTLGHDEFVAALLDGPELLLKFAGVRLLTHTAGDPYWQDGLLISARYATARWVPQFGPLRSPAGFPFTFRTSTQPVTGRTYAEVLGDDDAPIVSVLIDSAPAARGVSSIRWLCYPALVDGGRGTELMRLLNRIRRSPFALRESINAAELTRLAPGPSLEWRAKSDSVERQPALLAVS